MMAVKTFSRQRDGNTRLAANFKAVEFASRDGSDKILIDTRLVDVLQKIRDWTGRPVNINSGFRSPVHNAAVGGAARSFHLQGKAADITIRGLIPTDMARWAEAALRDANIQGGIIVYNTFTHIDVRAARYRAVNDNGRVTANSGWAAMPVPNAPAVQLLAEAGANVEAASFNVRVTNVPLNVRMGPGINYDAPMQIRRQGIYSVIAEADGPGGDGVWYMIVAGEGGALSGWISRQFTEIV